MSIWMASTAVLSSVVVTLIWAWPTERTVEIAEKRAKMDPNRNWYVYVEPTGDPNIYRGVYERDGRRKYEVEGHGITNTLRNLADEVGF